MTTVAHFDDEAEAAVIAFLLADLASARRMVIIDEKVRPEHFYRERHAVTMDAILRLHEQGAGTDHVTVAGKLRDVATPAARNAATHIDAMAAAHWSPGSIPANCQTVIALHAWRQRNATLDALRSAVAVRDNGLFDQALAQLARVDRHDDNAAYEPAEVTGKVLDHIEGKVTRPVWHWPLRKLDALTLGGLRRGQVTLVSGPTRHGKSVFLDQVLEQCARDGASTRLYLNEMTAEERGMRCAARGAVIPHERIVNGSLTPQDAERVMDWASTTGVPFAMQECDGWTAQDVARDARHRRLDVVAFDLLDEVPLLPGMSRRETAEESMRVFKQLALGAGCHVFVVAHLNRARSAAQATVPIPALSDIRESGMLANRAHNVLFVWREQDRDTGDPEETGVIRVAKARAGRLGSVEVIFDGDRQRFLPDHSPDLRRVA